MSNDIAKQIWDLGTAMNVAAAQQFRQAELQHRVVYLLWRGEVVLGVCGTRTRAEQEAEDLGHALNEVIRIEPRMVNS
jgi:hypothetical protein